MPQVVGCTGHYMGPRATRMLEDSTVFSMVSVRGVVDRMVSAFFFTGPHTPACAREDVVVSGSAFTWRPCHLSTGNNLENVFRAMLVGIWGDQAFQSFSNPMSNPWMEVDVVYLFRPAIRRLLSHLCMINNVCLHIS